MKNWVKKLGQWHLYESGKYETLCEKAMLGNNYNRYIPKNERIKCEECFNIKYQIEGNVNELSYTS